VDHSGRGGGQEMMKSYQEKVGAYHQNMEVHQEEMWAKITTGQEVEDIPASRRTHGHISLTRNYGSCPL
jgi:hypothetical protein